MSKSQWSAWYIWALVKRPSPHNCFLHAAYLCRRGCVPLTMLSSQRLISWTEKLRDLMIFNPSVGRQLSCFKMQQAYGILVLILPVDVFQFDILISHGCSKDLPPWFTTTSVVRKGNKRNLESNYVGVFSVQKFNVNDKVNSIFSVLLLIQDQLDS